MSSASSGRYQSRLFNFVHRQSRRLTQQCERAFWELKLATNWVAPVVLYPLYLLFQSSRAAAKQVHQAVQQNRFQLQAHDSDSQPQAPSTADTPIQRVLLSINVPLEEEEEGEKGLFVGNYNLPMNPLFPNGFKPLNLFIKKWNGVASLFKLKPLASDKRYVPLSSSPSLPLSFLKEPADSLNRNRPVIRGIATQLSNHNLVLIAAQNEILDILTPQQQQKLQERIIGEVADYWEQRSKRKRVTPAPQPASPLLPISPALPFLDQVLVFLDGSVAQVESNYLAPVSEVAIALGKRNGELVQRVQSLTDSRTSAMAADSFETHKFRIQALIWVAINYFFGDRGRLQIEQTTPVAESLELPPGSKPRRKRLPHDRSASKPVAQLSSDAKSISPDADPRLTLADLFGEAESSLETSTNSHPTQLASKTNQALPASQSVGYSLQHLLNSLQKFLPPKQNSTTLSPVSQPRAVSAGEISNQSRSQSTQIDPAPNWIETHATAMGYVKHPLERLLEWLDRAMLWLEDVLMSVLRWVHQLWQGK